MKKMIQNTCALMLIALCALPAMAQLNGTGYYRFRNAQYSTEYISMSNDLFNYTTCISTACGGLSQAASAGGQARAMACVGKYLETDIHMINDADIIVPGSVVYAKKKNTNSSNYEYNLIGQGTSLLTLTTGTYPGTAQLKFEDRYITIQAVSGSGANTLYTASIELKSSTYVIFVGYPNLGIRYLIDDNGTFSVNESSSATNAKWYIEPITHFNVQPEVELNGKWYTTIKVPFAFTLSGSVEKAYKITAVTGGVLSYQEISGTIPAGTPVLLQCGSPNAADCQLIPSGAPDFTAPDVSITSAAPRATDVTTPTEDNLLAGTYYCNTDGTMSFPTPSGTSSFNANHYTAISGKYVIGKNANGKLGFIAATGTAMPANKAWLTSAGVFPTVAAPTISLAGGTYNEAQTVTITAEDGATILYSTDGGATWNEYNEAIPIGEGTTTIQAKATKQGLYNDSEVVSATYTVEIPTPELAITPKSMTISDAAAGVFTITGTNVNGNINANLANTSDWYLNPETLSNTGGEVNVTYTGRALTAENTVNAYVANNPNVKSSATVNYQTDIFIVTDNGVEGGWNFGNGAQMANEDGIYTATFTATVPNTFILFARKLGDGVNWNTRYVFGPSSDGDWAMPGDKATEYGNIDVNDDDPIKLPYAGEYTITINGNDKTFTITRTIETVATPTFTPAAGTYTSIQSVTIACDTQEAVIHYTTDGSEPTANSPVYNEAIEVAENMTIKAIALKDGWNPSLAASAEYVINLPQLEAPVITPASGEYNEAQTVTITAADGANISYKIGDGEYTTYSGPFEVAESCTITAKASKTGYTDSEETSATYTIKYPVATPTFNPPAGSYIGAQEVTISCETEGAIISYSTDGTNWTEGNTVNVTESCTLYAKATKDGWNDSEEAKAEYVINYTSLTVNPTTLAINEESDSFAVNGSYLLSDVVVTAHNGFSTSFSSESNATADWGFYKDADNAVDGMVAVTYQGRELSATDNIDVVSGDKSEKVNVTYQADIYIVTDNGVEGQWNFSNGTQMTNEDGTYTATFNATADNTFILFAKKLGEGVDWNTRYVFGPSSDGDWEMPSDKATEYGSIDVYDDDPIKLPYAGEYTITINGNDKTFTITRKIETVASPTFTPAAGTYTGTQTVTIECETQGATILYKIGDGEYQPYNGSIEVAESCTITAKATKNGWNDSEEATAEYVIEIPVVHKPGDVNHDGAVNIKDVTDLIDYLLDINNGVCEVCANVKDDGTVNIADVTSLIDMLLGIQTTE
ncbi:MAG: chitobiase/beta-hexosaminidase C-terminal domain-containing protein [Muribaculaceae bacterium]|nr:chitobiase/beta-hexosaminidase C-terminal domain-containing protein [Muribaculaceae bacterium]